MGEGRGRDAELELEKDGRRVGTAIGICWVEETVDDGVDLDGTAVGNTYRRGMVSRS